MQKQQTKIIDSLLAQNAKLIEENSEWRRMFFDAFNHRPEAPEMPADPPETNEAGEESERDQKNRENDLKALTGVSLDNLFNEPGGRP